ncbi:MAG TPA: chitobiase/beta-hexosaminidase C-terminal domain-containing protein, partial [Candidatus Deferrimicrobiaceae bacterium]
MLLSAACGGGQGEGGSTGTSGARETVAAPVFSPPAGAYAGAQAVTISTATPGATIRYTTDGTMPTATTGIPYAGPVVVSDPKTLKAAAFKADLADSPRSFGVYAIGGKPRIAAGGGATAAVDGDG